MDNLRIIKLYPGGEIVRMKDLLEGDKFIIEGCDSTDSEFDSKIFLALSNGKETDNASIAEVLAKEI